MYACRQVNKHIRPKRSAGLAGPESEESRSDTCCECVCVLVCTCDLFSVEKKDKETETRCRGESWRSQKVLLHNVTLMYQKCFESQTLTPSHDLGFLQKHVFSLEDFRVADKTDVSQL